MGGAVASWLACLTPDQAVRTRDLAGDNGLCSWARHLTLTVPLSTQVKKKMIHHYLAAISDAGFKMDLVISLTSLDA